MERASKREYYWHRVQTAATGSGFIHKVTRLAEETFGRVNEGNASRAVKTLKLAPGTAESLPLEDARELRHPLLTFRVSCRHARFAGRICCVRGGL